jgi:hypothetical protein
VGGGGGMEEMNVREYNWWALHTYIHTLNRMMKSLVITLSGEGKGLQQGDGGGSMYNVRKLVQWIPPVQWIYVNKNEKTEKR